MFKILLLVGIDFEVVMCILYVEVKDNGVIGFVVVIGKSYFCEDMIEDLLYIDGLVGVKSFLMVLLIWYE